MHKIWTAQIRPSKELKQIEQILKQKPVEIFALEKAFFEAYRSSSNVSSSLIHCIREDFAIDMKGMRIYNFYFKCYTSYFLIRKKKAERNLEYFDQNEGWSEAETNLNRGERTA